MSLAPYKACGVYFQIYRFSLSSEAHEASLELRQTSFHPLYPLRGNCVIFVRRAREIASFPKSTCPMAPLIAGPSQVLLLYLLRDLTNKDLVDNRGAITEYDPYDGL